MPRRLLLLILMLCVAAPGIGRADDKILIAASGLAKQIHLPDVLCEKLGYFKQQGLDVEYVNIGNSGVNAENQLIAGVVPVSRVVGATALLGPRSFRLRR